VIHPLTAATKDADAVIALHFAGFPDRWAPTLASLSVACPGIPIIAGASEASALPALKGLAERYELTVEWRTVPNLEALLTLAGRDFERHLLLITAPVVVPSHMLDPALVLADAELRCASVSFLSNAAGYLQFPSAGVDADHVGAARDESVITGRLRRRSRALSPIPIPYAAGPAVLITRQGLSLLGSPPIRECGDPEVMLAEYSARSRAHGMVDYLDPSTFVTLPQADVSPLLDRTPLTTVGVRARHPQTAALTRGPTEPSEDDAGLPDVLQNARAAFFGLRVIVDAMCLGPWETGHQVTILALIEALAQQPEVGYLGVAVAGPLPSYAEGRLSDPKVDLRVVTDGDLTRFPQADVMHRPYQPSPGMRMSCWRRVGRRTVVTIHDLIAYQVPGYHDSPEAWFRYRKNFRSACSIVDGVIAISENVRDAVTDERMAVDPERLFVVPNAVSHLRGDEAEVMPEELLHRGFTGEEFLLVLGTDYTHKNRDLAIATLEALNARGHELSLVMAGAHVSQGSSRVAEAMAWSPHLRVYAVPSVTSAERNWLLRHASLVLYPTSAEGFGLIPDEAAAFGTPTVFVPFGPLAERYGDLPGLPRLWTPEAFADAAEVLLFEPAVAKAQVAAIARRGGDQFDWGAVARATVATYWSLLARPPHARTRIAAQQSEESER
jgi:glycosyltransferase involved in cell wall biosynthesis